MAKPGHTTLRFKFPALENPISPQTWDFLVELSDGGEGQGHCKDISGRQKTALTKVATSFSLEPTSVPS